MGTLISVVVISLFISIVLVNKIDISWYMKGWLKIPKSKRLKPFDCLSCFTFWISIIITFAVMPFVGRHPDLFTQVVSIMAAYVAAFAIQK